MKILVKKYATVLLCLMVAGAGCKKSSPAGSSGSLLATVDKSHAGGVSHYRFVYTSTDQLDSIIETGGAADTGSNYSSYFTYGQSSFTLTDNYSNVTTVYDSDGIVEQISTYDTLIFGYSGSVVGSVTDKSSSPVYPFYVDEVYNYNWSGNNIASYSYTGSGTFNYTYNTAKSGQAGDPTRINYFLSYGITPFRTANLPTEISVNGVWFQDFFYQFDNSGRITTLTEVINNNGVGVDDTTLYQYTYYY